MADTDTSDSGARRPAHGSGAGGEMGKRRRIFLAIASVPLAVVAGSGAWFMFGQDAGETKTAAGAQPPVVAEPQKLEYIDLNPFFINVESAGGQRQNIVLLMALEVVRDGEAEIRVRRALPQLYEAYLRALTGRPLPPASDGLIEITHVKNRMRAENLRLLGPGAVNDVVLRNIYVIEG